MNRKHTWEIGATILLLIAFALSAIGGFAWWERQRRLDAELVKLLGLPVDQEEQVQIRSLVRQGASVHARDETGWTVLMQAAFFGDVELAREALRRGAKVDASPPGGGTALHVACHRGETEIVRLLLTHGAEANPRSFLWPTPLKIAQEWNHSEIIRLLKQHGAKP